MVSLSDAKLCSDCPMEQPGVCCHQCPYRHIERPRKKIDWSTEPNPRGFTEVETEAVGCDASGVPYRRARGRGKAS